MSEHAPADTVAVLGWYAREQSRIDFVRLVSAGFGTSTRAAYDLLNESLERAVFIVIRNADDASTRRLAREIERCGCEVRVLPGDAESENDPISQEARRIRLEVEATLSLGLSRVETAERMHRIAPEYRVTTAE